MNYARRLAVLSSFALLGANGFAHAQAGNFEVRVPAASCDGVTDATTAIIDAIAAAGIGGTVQLPSGVCYISGNSSITLNDIALTGSEVPHHSDATAGAGIFEAGTVISIGREETPPGRAIPFRFGHSVTLRGLNFIYPYQIARGTLYGDEPATAPPLFSDIQSGSIGNILFENVHVVGAYEFWTQSANPAQTYGNIRFDNTDVYAIKTVFTWSNIRETVAFSNFISNPSLCNGGRDGCSEGLKAWTGDNGRWMRVIGGIDTVGSNTSVAGIQASNLTVTGYRRAILVEDNGHLDESIFGSTTVFDQVPTVLEVKSNGSVTHSVFSGKIEFAGKTRSGRSYDAPAFKLDNPQYPLPNDPIQDHNSLSLNGLTADGLGGALVEAIVSSGDVGSITMTGVVVRHYCAGPTAKDAVTILAPFNERQSTAVIIVGSQFTSQRANCGGLNVVTNGAPFVNTGNLVGFYPLN